VRRIATIAAVLVLVHRAALAQPDEVGRPDAKRLFDEARALVEQGKPAEACAVFQRSYDLERAAGTMLNLAECAERDGKYRRAWLLYDAAAQEYDRSHKPGPAKFARDRAEALTAKLATIVVRLAEPRVSGLTVRIGDHAAPPAPQITERIDPGTVSVAVTAPGREPFKTVATAEPARQVIVDVPVLRTVGPAPPQLPVTVDAPPPGPRRRSRLYLAAGLGAGGVLALATSGVLGLAANRAYDKPFDAGECIRAEPQPQCSDRGAAQLRDAGSTADLATGVAIAGAALVAAGAVVFFTAPRETVVAPSAGPGTLGVTVSRRF
jgi:hypothetical protein